MKPEFVAVVVKDSIVQPLDCDFVDFDGTQRSAHKSYLALLSLGNAAKKCKK